MDIPPTATSIMAAAQDQRLRKRKMKHFGHIIRHNSLEKTIIQGITAGKRGRGRPARTWEKDIEEWARTNIDVFPSTGTPLVDLNKRFMHLAYYCLVCLIMFLAV